MTYSIVARDAATGDLGVAVQSHYFGVGRVVPWAAAGVGAVATQSIVKVSYGPDGLAAMANGSTADEALRTLTAADADRARRQVAMVDASGRVAVHTGTACIASAGHATGDGVSVQANLVESPTVWESMLHAFGATSGNLAVRLLAALLAAESSGGDLRGSQSAALVVVRAAPTGDPAQDRIVDLRVDDAVDPLAELSRLLANVHAFGDLSALLERDGLMFGPFTAAADEVAAALHELDAAQRVVGASNREPSLWRGLLLARAGRDAEATSAFRYAAGIDGRVPQLVRNLAAAGAWPRDAAALDRVLDLS